METADFPLTDPGTTESERDTLVQFLDYYRQVLLRKAAGLSGEELAQTLGTSDLTLGGLLKHMSVVEANWFVRRFEGEEYPEPWASAPWDEDGDWELHSAAQDTPEYLVELFTATVARSQAILDTIESLDELSARTRDGVPWSMRWILVHLIEEYARHVGHADLIRESIDGATGD